MGERQTREPRYRLFRHDPTSLFVCFYCGMPADTVDHCPPITRVEDYRAMRLEHEDYVKVSCCRECNSLLGASLQETLVEREQFIKWRLEARYDKVLRLPRWTEGELGQMGRRMRHEIEASIRAQVRTLARLEYGAGVQAYIDAWEAQMEQPGLPVAYLPTGGKGSE